MLLLVDLDGVLWRSSEPVPGVAAVLARRAASGDDIVYVTNNSMHHRSSYVPRLAALGAPVSADRVVSSPRATALYLQTVQPPVRRVLVVGGVGLADELREAGFAVVTAGEVVASADGALGAVDGYEAAGRPAAVVVGLDVDLTYARIAAAADAVRAGALFVATNRDPVYPRERGLQPGAGSVVAAIAVAAGREPLSIGKPAPALLELAAQVAGGDARRAIMIGDGIRTDLRAAQAVGARCILMLTGVTTREEVDALSADERPAFVAADAVELARVLDALGSETAGI